MRLWTDKHRPVDVGGIIGQSDAVAQVRRWLSSWKPGTGLIVHGPTGTGKTLLVELLATERGDFLVRLDASDSMTGKDIESALSTASRQQTLFHRGKLILLDEVDCLSGRSDRGASSGIVKIITGSRFPVIVCVNDIGEPKLKPIKKVCKKVAFGKVDRKDMTSFLSAVARKENLSVGDGVLDSLARWSDGDVRSALLDLQMLSLGGMEVTEEKFLSLGFRERKKCMEDVLLGLMKTSSLKANRMALWNADADSDDIFLWLESNLFRTSADSAFIAEAYDVLSKADIFRGAVSKQQNWRFKAYMSDMMAGVGSLRQGPFVKPDEMRTPDRIILYARAKFSRALLEPAIESMSENLHCSRNVAKGEYLPYLRFMARSGMGVPEELGLSPEEAEALKR